MIISISGPIRTGKSTLISLLKDTLPEDTIFIEDIYITVWNDMIKAGIFNEFNDIAKDRDLLFIYISRVCEKYAETVNKYKDSTNLVVLECCHIDYLIYTQLHCWYHYPLQSFQEKVIIDLLKLQDCVSRIYMTTADDINYPLGDTKFYCKTYKAAFRRNRSLEIQFYNLYRNGERVVTLSPDIFSNDKVILDDLIEQGIL